MMTNSNRLVLATCLSLSLLGCQSLAPIQPSTPETGGAQTEGAKIPQATGTVSLTIRWPDGMRQGYNLAALPLSTRAFKLTLKKGSDPVEEKVLKRSEATWHEDGNGIATSVVRFDLPPGTGYSLEVKAFSSETDLSEATQVAAGTSSPFEVRSGYRTPVRISLAVPNGPQATALSHAAGAVGSRIRITGVNFGTDRSKIRAVVLREGYAPFPATIEALNSEGTEVTVVMPDAYTGGLVKLRLYVDGISANELDFCYLGGLSVELPALPTRQNPSNWATYYHALAGKPFPLLMKGEYSDPQTGEARRVESFEHRIKVLKDGLEVPGAVGSDGRITLPSIGNYTLEVSAGTQWKSEFPIVAGTLNWFNTAPAMVKVSNFYELTGHYQSVDVSLPAQMIVDGGVSSVWLRPSDYTWTFSNPSIGTIPYLSSDWNQNQPNIQLYGTGIPGQTTVTGTLKLDPTKSFSFTLMNVGIQGFTFPTPVIKLRANETTEVAASVKLTDGTLVNPREKSDLQSKFHWTIDLPSLATVTKKSGSQWDSSTYGVGVVTAGSQVGSGTITLMWVGNSTAQTTIPIEVTDDGRLDLTIE